MNSIKINNISKSFGDVKALDNISLRINDGELFGLIGPDGAGKTTLFKLLVTLLKADSGTSTVCGLDTVSKRKEIRQIVGYMPGTFSLYRDLTVYENLKFFADIFGTTIEKGYDLIKDIWVQIEPFKNRLSGKLSGGMKQKLALCCALVHQPEVLFLDEPTTGVDPVSRKEFWQMLRKLKEKKITIFVSTPYMDEAVLCDRVALIQDGRILSIDTPEGVIDSFPKDLYEIKPHRVYEVLRALYKWDKSYSSNAFGNSVHFIGKDDNVSVEQILGFFKDSGISVEYVKRIKPSIEDCFIEFMSDKK